MSDPDPALVPNNPSCKPYRESSNNGYYGRQGVESSRQRGQIVDRWEEDTLRACAREIDQDNPASEDH